MTVIIDFVKNNWVAFSTSGVFLTGAIIAWRNYLDSKKLILEIKKLKSELEDKKSSIQIATLDQILELTNRKDIKGLKNLLRTINKTRVNQEINLSIEQADMYSEAIEYVDDNYSHLGYCDIRHLIVVYLFMILNQLSFFWVQEKTTGIVALIYTIIVILFYALTLGLNKRFR